MPRTGDRLVRELAGVGPVNTCAIRKGRSAEMIEKRNRLLVLRYVYYVIYSDLRTAAINSRIQEEFHITERTFLPIIYDSAAEIKTMKAQPPTISFLIRTYPHLSWTTKTHN